MADSPITPAKLQRLKALFDESADLAPAERESFLVALTGDDHSLVGDLRALLAAHDSTGEHLVSPLPISLGVPEPSADRWTGTRVGVYAVGECIGEGGMGTVYSATRADDQFEKRVALKFLRRTAESDLAISRFRYERQILANLSHPNIAALVDGGVAPDGQPYFAMEYVDGTPITTWCDARRLELRGRLVLFLQVCAAVQHAHQHLVIHRDLKPGNILVTGDGTVKLLDFGIAKLLREEEGLEQLPATRGGARVFTPEYAAPEQVRGMPVSTSTDVYALGVVLFELLTGRRPFALQGRLIAEIEEIVCREQPPRPSAALLPEMPARLGLRSAGHARGQLAGDLDAIVLTALRKEPDRRYGSADQLARDIGAYLDGLPVAARPDALGYRVAKFVRRRRVEVAASTLLVVSLVGGVIATTRQARTAEAERDRATAVTSFLTTMLAAPDPAILGREVTMREVLDSAVMRVDTLRNRPDLEFEVRSVIAVTYLGLGAYDAAIEQYRLALDAAWRQHPKGGHRVATAMSRLALGLEMTGDYGGADSLVTAALEEIGKLGTRPTSERIAWLDQRGRLLQRMGDSRSAATMFREVARVQAILEPTNDSALAVAQHNLAVALNEINDHRAADSLLRNALMLERRSLGELHPLVAASTSTLAGVLESMGNFPAADSAYRVALALRERILGPEHPDYAWTMFNYADFLLRTEQWSEAAMWARRVVALRDVLPESHPGVSVGLLILGRALGRLDSFPEAEALLRESLAVRVATYPKGHWLIASGESTLGEHMTLAGRYGEAERLLVPAEAQLVELRGEEHEIVQTARRRLIALYTAWGKPAEVERWSARIVTKP